VKQGRPIVHFAAENNDFDANKDKIDKMKDAIQVRTLILRDMDVCGRRMGV